jgi:hypothetical protein
VQVQETAPVEVNEGGFAVPDIARRDDALHVAKHDAIWMRLRNVGERGKPALLAATIVGGFAHQQAAHIEHARIGGQHRVQHVEAGSRCGNGDDQVHLKNPAAIELAPPSSPPVTVLFTGVWLAA